MTAEIENAIKEVKIKVKDKVIKLDKSLVKNLSSEDIRKAIDKIKSHPSLVFKKNEIDITVNNELVLGDVKNAINGIRGVKESRVKIDDRINEALKDIPEEKRQGFGFGQNLAAKVADRTEEEREKELKDIVKKDDDEKKKYEKEKAAKDEDKVKYDMKKKEEEMKEIYGSGSGKDKYESPLKDDDDAMKYDRESSSPGAHSPKYSGHR